MANQNDLRLIANIIERLDNNRISNFSYTPQAFADNDIDSVANFDFSAEQNIPESPETNVTVLTKGLRASGASISRDGWNHFIGRSSYNINKTVQKIKEMLTLTKAAWAHNAFEYDPYAKYAFGDICYWVETIGSVKTFAYHQRISQSPSVIMNVPPSVSLHWAPMQNKTSTSALLPFKAPGYQHKYTIVDLTSGYVPNTWYPAITTLQGFDAKIDDAQTNTLQVLIEAYCNGTVAGVTGNHKAEITMLSKFTGFADSSTDIVLDNSFVSQADGAIRDAANSPIGFSKLPKGRQAVLWLKGGSRYAVWNSMGSLFTLATGAYDNRLDTPITPVNQRPFAVTPGAIQARVQTPIATLPNEAVNLQQVNGSIPLPRILAAGSQLDSVRAPGVYIADTVSLGNSIGNVPILDPGIFELTVKGDKAGLTVTTQRFIQRSTGNEYIRVLAGNAVVKPWYLASSPDGIYVEMQGLYAFQIDSAGHLILHYQNGTDIPAFSINEDGHLMANIA
jgi:hypothetical protein